MKNQSWKYFRKETLVVMQKSLLVFLPFFPSRLFCTSTRIENKKLINKQVDGNTYISKYIYIQSLIV